MISVLVVSDIRLYREGLSKILNEVQSIQVIGNATNVKQALDIIILSHPDIVLLDMSMIDNCKVIDAIENETYKSKLIVLSMDEDETKVLACAEAGISGYLSRDSSLEELLEAVLQVYNGGIYCPPCITKHLLSSVKKHKSKSSVFNTKSKKPAVTDVLTRRERQVVNMMADGFSNKQIARNLTIEVSTVKNHVHSVLVKLDAKSRTQAVSMLQHGLST